MKDYESQPLNDSKKDIPSKDFSNEIVRYKAAPIWTRALMLSIATTFGFGFVFACIAKIDEVVIAKGELQAIGAERPIKSPISGVLSKILVSEGQSVSKGQSLLLFDTKNLEARKESLLAKLNELISTLETEKNILKEISVLAEIGGIQRLQYLQQKNRVNELTYEIKQSEANIKEVGFEISKTNLNSPVKGRVFNLIAISPGYAATLGETLLKIVPDGAVEAKVFLSNFDIGFIEKDMNAQIRVDAYPFTQFGYIDGKLKSIAEEVLPPDQQNPAPRFPAYVELSSQYLERDGKKYKVRSGQSVSVNLVVREKPVITLLSDVFDRSIDSLKGIKNK